MLNTERGIVFTVDDFFWESTIDLILEAAMAAGFESLEKVFRITKSGDGKDSPHLQLFPRDYRSNDRLLARSKHLADEIYNRVLEYYY